MMTRPASHVRDRDPLVGADTSPAPADAKQDRNQPGTSETELAAGTASGPRPRWPADGRPTWPRRRGRSRTRYRSPRGRSSAGLRGSCAA